MQKENKEEENYCKLSEPTVKQKHNWKQYGNQIICDSCPSKHGMFIRTDQIMVGVDDNGMPILEKRF